MTEPIILIDSESGERITHVLEDREHWAVKGAMAANRPLLVRGEPGIGKTQLAWAIATKMNRPLVSLTLDSNTEARDLLWTFDAVQRLAEAQVASATTMDKKELRDEIAVKRFIKPGPVWWAFDWNSAQGQLSPGEEPPVVPAPNQDGNKWEPTDGVVMLIDEIDKAESDVPNGLLEALGYRRFTPQGWDKAIRLSDDVKPPLIIITTNEERVLPDAFLRRCFVLPLELPNVNSHEQEFITYLVRRGEAHFPDCGQILIEMNRSEQSRERSSDDSSREELPLPVAAAQLLAADRKRAISAQQSPLPGQAEYLDFLRAIVGLVSRGEDAQEVFQQLQSFVFSKHSGILR